MTVNKFPTCHGTRRFYLGRPCIEVSDNSPETTIACLYFDQVPYVPLWCVVIEYINVNKVTIRRIIYSIYIYIYNLDIYSLIKALGNLLRCI